MTTTGRPDDPILNSPFEPTHQHFARCTNGRHREVAAKRAQTSVSLCGVGVEPWTGEVRTCGADQVALRVMDTDDRGESFSIRRRNFTGGQNPYKPLRAGLRGDIYEYAWVSIYATEPRQLPLPTTDRIPVEAFTPGNDEAVKVLEV